MVCDGFGEGDLLMLFVGEFVWIVVDCFGF